MHNSNEEKDKKKKKIIILLLLLFIVFAALIGTITLLIKHDNDGGKTVIPSNVEEHLDDEESKQKDDADDNESAGNKDKDTEDDEVVGKETENKNNDKTDNDNANNGNEGNSSKPSSSDKTGNGNQGSTNPSETTKPGETTTPTNPGESQEPETPTTPTCVIKDDKYYDADGKIVGKEDFRNSCSIEPEDDVFYHCQATTDGRFYDKDGYAVTEGDYNASCKGEVEKPAPTRPVVKGYESTENSITITYTEESEYEEANCFYGPSASSLPNKGTAEIKSDGTFVCKAENLEADTTYYFMAMVRNGEHTTASTAQSFKTNSANEGVKHYCENVDGKYYDANGNEVDKDAYNKSCTPEEPTPTAPSILSSHVTDSSITVNFGPSDNANSYTCSANGIKGVVTELSGSYQCNISGLEDGKRYNVTITAKNETKENATTTTLTTEYKTPSAPVFSKETVSQNKISADFSLSADAKSYTCYIKEASASTATPAKATVLEDVVHCDFDGLKAQTNYIYYVTAFRGDKSASSTEQTTRTANQTPANPVITKETVTASSIALEIKTDEYTQSLTCEYGLDENSFTQGHVSATATGYACAIDTLTADTNYKVRLTAYNGPDAKSSITTTIRTNPEEVEEELAPGKPTLASHEETANYIKAVYGVVANANSYSCTLESFEGSEYTNAQTKAASITDEGVVCEYTGLKEDAKYRVKLTATNIEKSTASDYTELQTKALVVSKPENTGKTVTDTTFEVKFTKAENAESYSCSYGSNPGTLSFPGTIKESGNEVICSAQGLSQNSTYYVQLTATRKDTNVQSDVVTVTTAYAKPEAPVYKSSEVTENSITAKYTKPENAETATCYYGSSSEGLRNTVLGKISGDEIICEINNLQPKTSYFVQVKVTNGDVEAESTIRTIETDEDAPAAITYHSHEVTYGDTKAEDTLTVNFGPLVGTYSDYSYECSAKDEHQSIISGTTSVKLISSDRYLVCTFRGVNEGSTYETTAKISKGDKNTTATKDALYVAYKTPEAPTYISSEKTSSSIEAKFNLNGRYTRYTCQYGTDISSLTAATDVSVDRDELTCRIENLNPATEYKIVVTAYNGPDLHAEVTQSITTTEITLSEPTFVKADSTETTITALFTKSDNATNYVCYIGEDFSTMTTLGIATLDGENDTVKCSFSGLKQNTTYYFKVIATRDTINKESHATTYKTLATNPSVPEYKSFTEAGNSISAVYNINGPYEEVTCQYGLGDAYDHNGLITKNVDGTVTCNAANLSENTTYNFKVTVKNGTMSVSSTGKALSTTYVPPKTPGYESYTRAGGNITVRFVDSTADSNFPAEKVECYTSVDDKGQLTLKGEANYSNGKAVCTINNPEAGHSYFFKAVATRHGRTSESTIVEITLEKPVVTPATFKSSQTGTTTITTEWTLNGAATRHTCLAGTNKDNLNITGAFSNFGNDVTCTFQNLQPGTKYYVEFRSYIDPSPAYSQVVSDATVKEITTDAKASGTCEKGYTPESVLSDGKIVTVLVNSPCSVDVNSAEAKKAYNLAKTIGLMDVTKVLADVPAVSHGIDYGQVEAVTTKDGKVAGYVVHVTIYGNSWEDFLGGYRINNKGERVWYDESYKKKN